MAPCRAERDSQRQSEAETDRVRDRVKAALVAQSKGSRGQVCRMRAWRCILSTLVRWNSSRGEYVDCIGCARREESLARPP